MKVKIIAEPISAIVRFKNKQKPVPYKFLYTDQCGLSHEIKIDKINEVSEVKLVGIKSLIYRCESNINGIQKMYELKYVINEYRWELYKM